MKQTLYNIGIWILTTISGVVNLTNIATWLNENKIFFNISGAILITIVTLIWWILRIISDNRKSNLEIEKLKYDLKDREISCEERKIQLEINKQSLK